jgi:hypothetical protein
MQISSKDSSTSTLVSFLTDDQQEDPVAVIKTFFESYHIEDFRREIWAWLATALSSDNTSGLERSGLIFLYENILSLVEASFLLYIKEPAKKSKKQNSKTQNRLKQDLKKSKAK